MERSAPVRSWWPWVVALLVLALLVWAVSGMLAGPETDVEVQEAVPTAR